MLKLQEGQFVKLVGTKVKGENDIYVVDSNRNDEDYTLIKVKLDGTQKSGGYRYYFYNKRTMKNDSDLQIEIVTDLKKAKKDVNTYLKNLNNNEIDVKFIKAENQEVKDNSIIRFPKGIQFGMFGNQYIGSRTIWQVNFRENKTIYITELGKKGQSISTGKSFGCTLGLTNKMIEECEVLEKVETRKGDLVKESKKIIKPVKEEVKENIESVEIIAEAPEVETIETVQEEQPAETTTNNLEIEVKFNTEKNGIELYFSDEPSNDFRSQLKANKFRWNGRSKCWYTKDTDEARAFLSELGLLNDEGEQETNTIQESAIEKVEYPEININDIESYTVSKELSKRENDTSMFRREETDHTKEIQLTMQNANDEVLKALEGNTDDYAEYKAKTFLQSWKKKYYNNYIRRLSHKASNPSWMITGRGNLDSNRYNKKLSQYDKMIGESVELTNEFNSRISKIKNIVKKQKESFYKKETEKLLNSEIELPKFEKKTIKYNVSAVNYIFNDATSETKANYYNGYYIFKNWGCWRVYNQQGKEILRTNTTQSLQDAKKLLMYRLREEKEAV